VRVLPRTLDENSSRRRPGLLRADRRYFMRWPRRSTPVRVHFLLLLEQAFSVCRSTTALCRRILGSWPESAEPGSPTNGLATGSTSSDADRKADPSLPGSAWVGKRFRTEAVELCRRIVLFAPRGGAACTHRHRVRRQQQTRAVTRKTGTPTSGWPPVPPSPMLTEAVESLPGPAKLTQMICYEATVLQQRTAPVAEGLHLAVEENRFRFRSGSALGS
jgi:hypothetical protein